MSVVIEKLVHIDIDGETVCDTFIECKMTVKEIGDALSSPEDGMKKKELDHILNDAFIIISEMPDSYMKCLDDDIANRAIEWLDKLKSKFVNR